MHAAVSYYFSQVVCMNWVETCKHNKCMGLCGNLTQFWSKLSVCNVSENPSSQWLLKKAEHRWSEISERCNISKSYRGVCPPPHPSTETKPCLRYTEGPHYQPYWAWNLWYINSTYNVVINDCCLLLLETFLSNWKISATGKMSIFFTLFKWLCIYCLSP